MKRPQLGRFMLFAGVFFAGYAAWCVWCASTGFAKPVEFTRLVFRFEGTADGKSLDSAREVMEARLKDLGAAEVTAECRGASEVLLEFVPPFS